MWAFRCTTYPAHLHGVEITYPKKTCCNIKICSDMITLFYLWDFPTFPHLFFGCISSKVEKLHQKLPVAFVVRDEHIKAHDLMPWSELEFLITWEASSGFTWKKQTHTHYLKKNGNPVKTPSLHGDPSQLILIQWGNYKYVRQHIEVSSSDLHRRHTWY